MILEQYNNIFPMAKKEKKIKSMYSIIDLDFISLLCLI